MKTVVATNCQKKVKKSSRKQAMVNMGKTAFIDKSPKTHISVRKANSQ